MTEEQLALFRADMFERAAKILVGEPVDPPAKPGEAAASTAAPEPAEDREVASEKGSTDGR